jgi:hypothetical protein
VRLLVLLVMGMSTLLPRGFCRHASADTPLSVLSFCAQ